MCFRLIATLALFLLGCQQHSVIDSFKLETEKRWIAGTKVSWVSDHYSPSEAIKSPEGTWQALLRINFLDQQFNEVSDCLIYKIPSQKQFGILKVVANPKMKNCLDLLHEEPYTQKESIVNFGYELHQELGQMKNLILKVDQDQYDYEFLNMQNDKMTKELLSHARSHYKTPGFIIASQISYQVSRDKLQDAEKCLELNEDCAIIRDDCHLCERSSYAVVSKGCTKNYERLCGQDLCGEKNHPACVRGFITAQIDPTLYCINDSPVGFCAKGLRVICLNGMLVCL